MQTLSPSRLLLLILCSVYVSAATAQKINQQAEELRKAILSDPAVSDVRIETDRLTPSVIRMSRSIAARDKSSTKNDLEKFLNVRPGIDMLVAEKTSRLPDGIEVVEYQQYYKGIKVDRARFKAFINNGKVEFYSGAWYNVQAGLSLQPVLQQPAALEQAKRTVKARKWAWEQARELVDKEPNMSRKLRLQQELADYAPKSELVVVENLRKDGPAEMRLAYKINVYAVEPVSRAWVYVDAENGQILFRDEIIKHVDGPKTGTPPSTSVATTVQTRYAGNRVIKTKQISGTDPITGLPLTASNPTELYIPGSATYALIDDSKGGGIETFDLNGVGGLPISLAPAYSQAKSFTDFNNNWTLAEHKRGGAVESENDDIAWDAHWGAGVVYDYWKARHNRLSYDGNDARIRSFIHSGIGYDNAFWNGSVMTYGDGSYPAPGGFRPLTSLDVCGHEIGHGVCSFTSDLVYAKESGAMNEALSDIWAACIEYYAIKNIDPALGSVYKPFHIGEQISANPASPLRRMDNPKAAGNPDTYGGQNWRNPDCSPSLANDQCGVHNNSGVLNKWFYLLTVGSGAGSGPDASFAGEDDGINDKGNAYSVTGLGFAVSEKIVFAMETMLSSTATYAEAREVSIQVAAAISGNPCSSMVKTVTDAWYAVGVGNAFVQPCSITYGFTYQPGSFVSEGQSGSGCTAETAVEVPVLLPPNSTASISLSGTATLNSDYRVSTATLSNNTSNPAQAKFTIFVKNDAIVEGDEYVTASISISNTGSNPVNSSYRLTIVEDDVIPVISNGSKLLLNESFTRADGFEDPAGWTEMLEVPEEPNGTQAAKGKNQWGIFGNKLTITGREELTGTQLPGGLYNNNSESSTIISSPLIDARGLNSLQLKFDYQVQGEQDPSGTTPDTWPALDYMAIVYSFDGVTWYELGQPPFVRFASAAPTSGTFANLLPAFLNNKQFYLGFRWHNDPLLGGPVSVSVDNLSLQGAGRKIETRAGDNSRENLGNGNDAYFYSIQDGEILGHVKNASGKDYGCTNVFVEKGGTGAFNLYQSPKDGLHKVADKVFRIEASLIYKGNNTVTFYYTEAELAALELATGQDRTAFGIYQVSATSYALASAQNTKRYAAVYTPLPGVGGAYTASFNNTVNGSFALGVAVSIPGLQRSVEGNAFEVETTQWKFGSIHPNPAAAAATLVITAPAAQRLRVEIVNGVGQLVAVQSEQVQPGQNRVQLPTAKLGSGNYLVRITDEKNERVHTQPFVRQ